MPTFEVTTDLGDIVLRSIPKLSIDEWGRLREVLREHPVLEFDELARLAEIPPPFAAAIAFVIQAQGLGSIKLSVFHACSDLPVRTREWREGFQPVPFKCPCCKVLVTTFLYLAKLHIKDRSSL